MKKKATSNIKLQQVFSSLRLNDVGTYLRDEPFKTDIKIVTLHQPKGTYWVLYINENYFDSFACAPPQKLSNFTIKRNKPCLYSEYKIQGLTNKQISYCSSYSLYIFYSIKVIKIDFKSAVLNLYYQRFS